jgi:hypothetical protein
MFVVVAIEVLFEGRKILIIRPVGHGERQVGIHRTGDHYKHQAEDRDNRHHAQSRRLGRLRVGSRFDLDRFILGGQGFGNERRLTALGAVDGLACRRRFRAQILPAGSARKANRRKIGQA